MLGLSLYWRASSKYVAGNKQLPCDIPGLGVPMKNQPGPITGSLIHLSTLHLKKMDYWPTLKSTVKNQPHPFTLSLPTSSEPYFTGHSWSMKNGLCPVNKNLFVTFGPVSLVGKVFSLNKMKLLDLLISLISDLFPELFPKRPLVEIRTWK